MACQLRRLLTAIERYIEHRCGQSKAEGSAHVIDVLMLCREALQAKKHEAAEVGAAMKKLQEQESKAQQAVDSLQQKTR